MAWHRLNESPDHRPSAIDEPACAESDAAQAARRATRGLDRCDARSIWVRASQFKKGQGQSGCVPVAVEVHADASAAQRDAVARCIRLRGIYDAAPGGDNFWTGAIAPDELAALSRLDAVKGWRTGLGNVPEVRTTPPFDSVAPDGSPPQPVVGIIDHGIAVAHPAFRMPGARETPRLISLWDQSPDRCSAAYNREGHWQAVAGIEYGGEVSNAKLRELIAQSQGCDRQVYEHLQYDPVLRRVSHGTHVLDVAAGWPNPLRPAQANPDAEAVSRSPIVAVQLPYRPVKDASGSTLCVNVLDALHYIVRKAGKNARVVINLSDGAYGGPHDGQSMLERAIDDFLQRHRQVTLVLAAGNAHETRGHARRESLAKDELAEFDWRVLPDDGTDSFLEVWFDQVCPAGSLALTLTPPAGAEPVTVEMGSRKLFIDEAGGVVAAVISMPVNPDGPARSMFLVALAPTRLRHSNGQGAPHGLWRVAVRNICLDTPVQLDAWIERDNPVFDESGPKRQSVFEVRGSDSRYVVGQGTLGSLAGSAQAIVVGARYLRGKVFREANTLRMSSVARYSSRGPGRAGEVQGPDLLAPSDRSPVLHGLRAAANRAGATFSMDGTSVAAPIVTRRVVNLLGSDHPPADRDGLLRAMIGPSPFADPDHTGERGSIEPGHEPVSAVSLARRPADA
jgi:subtilisin family serine protease